MWNYRIIKDKDTYGLHEVMYDDEGNIIAHSENAEVCGESPQDILETLEIMLSDVKKNFHSFFPPKYDAEKILELDKIKFSPMYNEEDLIEPISLEEFLDDATKDKNI
jgi:YD repeat-containing protein